MLLTDAPGLLTLALFAFVLLISLKLLDMLRRTIIYWISVALRLALWAAVAGVGIYVWQRGVEQSVKDFGWVIGFLAGLENEGERIGHAKASRRAGDASRMPKRGPKGRARGAGWN